MGKKKSKDLTQDEWLEQALVPESEWPYRVPGNWRWVRLGAVTNYIQRGKSPKYSDEKIIPVVSQKCVQWTGFDSSVVKYITPNSLISYSDERFIQAGDILWNSTGTGTLGRVALYSGELDHFDKVVVDSHVTVIRTNRINYKFAYYFLTSPLVQDGIEKRASGTTNQIELSSEMVKGQVFPLPPLTEQQRIVERIESLFEKLDQAKGLIQEALDSFENRKAAILHKAFSGELTKKWREENGIGMGSWERKRLKDVAEFRSGYAFDSSKFSNEGLQVIRMGNLYNGVLDLTRNPVFVKREDIEPSILKRSKVNKNDILLTLTGTKYKRDYGYAVIVADDIDALLNQRMLALTAKTLETYYLKNYLKTNLFRDVFFSNETGGVNQGNVSSKFVETIEIPVPTSEEQKKIVSLLVWILENENRAYELCDLIESIKCLKKSILTRAFRGEMGTNDSTEENAIELLEKHIFGTNSSGRKKKIKIIQPEVSVVALTVMEALEMNKRMTPEQLKGVTELEIDDFYEQIKKLIKEGSISEIRENNTVYLEVASFAD